MPRHRRSEKRGTALHHL